MDPMKKKKLEIILAVVLILAVIIALIIIFWQKPTGDEPVITDQPPVELPDTPGTIETPGGDTTYVSPSEPQEVAPETVIRDFVVRFGSFSSESDYINIEDVMPMATASLQSRLDVLAEDARNDNNGLYYGVSTKVISMTEVSNSGTIAVFTATTQRIESIDAPGNTSVRYQDIEVTLVKNGLGWLVDDFTWQ
ncbi:MAG: hypothetical protein ABH846_00375 [Patescibacteria group bacterium]